MAFEDKTRALPGEGQAPAPGLLREMVSTLVQERIRAEFDRFLGAAPYERSEQAPVLAMIEMYFHGVSTRQVTAIVEQLCGTGISASEVSALTRKLDVTLTAWRERRLADTAYPALVVDAHVEQVRREGHVRATAALWVVGVTPAPSSCSVWCRLARAVRRSKTSVVQSASPDKWIMIMPLRTDSS